MNFVSVMSHVINPKTTVGRRDPMQEFPSFVDPFWKIFYFTNEKNGGGRISSCFQMFSPLLTSKTPKSCLWNFYRFIFSLIVVAYILQQYYTKNLSSNTDAGNEIDYVHESSSTSNTNNILLSCDTTNQHKRNLLVG